MKNLFYFLLFAISISACGDKEMPLPIPLPDLTEPILVEPTDTACVPCKECKEGNGVTGPLCLWKSKLTLGNELCGNDIPYIFKHLAIFTRDILGKPSVIVFYHKASGKKLGEWADYEVGAPTSLSSKSMYSYGNTLVIGTGTRVYAIDLSTFKTKWMSKSHDWGGKEVKGIGNMTFHYTLSENTKTIYLEKGEVSSNKHEVIYEETVPNNLKVVYTQYHPYIDGKDTILLFWIAKYNFDTYVTNWYLASYNVTQKKLLYQEKINDFKNNGSFPYYPSVKDGKIYASIGQGAFCNDIKTGKEIWTKELPNHATFEGILGDDDNMYVVVMELDGSTLYCLDSKTGTELWTLLVDSGCQNMVCHKNVLYTVSSETTKIQAIDTKQKKVIWKYLTSENKNGGTNIFYIPASIVR
jgi:outer membrane protein assembly factor BamB